MKHWNDVYKEDPKDFKYYSLLKPHKDMPKISKIFKKRGVKKILFKHYKDFKLMKFWQDEKDYYCLLCENEQSLVI